MPMKLLTVPGESSSQLVKDASSTDVNGATSDEPPQPTLPDISHRRMSHMKTNLVKIQKSFRDQAHHVRHAIQQEARRVRKPPKWIQFFHTLYHDWGLKHACLILVLILYNFLGAAIFYYCEASHDENQEVIWKDNIAQNRSKFIQNIIPTMFNNTEFLFFLTGEQTRQVEERLNKELKLYEMQLGVKYKPDQKIKWDFWNAMLYAQTLCTTIGDAQLYTVTVFGRIFTMIYATFGIPLVLSVLDDMGKILTKCLKTPWWLIKCGCRRLFRYCTKQTMEEIKKLDAEDRHGFHISTLNAKYGISKSMALSDLEVFDLPIPIAVFVVVAWIFICSATFCIWEKDWDYFTAFYFFFICLSTIGLGDITPSQPKFFLLLFIYIIIGLSLASMCLNLIQARMKRTYDVGRIQFDNLSSIGGSENRLAVLPEGLIKPSRRRGSSLGVFRGCGSSYSLNREAVQAFLTSRNKHNKTCQTVLSFPSPSKNNLVCRAVNNARMKFLPRTLSIDDVMKLVDTEEGDILLLTELTRDESVNSVKTSSSTNTDDLSDSQIVISKSFDTNFNPSTLIETRKSATLPAVFQPRHASSIFTTAPESSRGNISGIEDLAIPVPRIRPSMITLQELEAQEEEEDRVLLGNTNVLDNSGVHFRSRLSLIPEQHSVIDEDTEHSVMESESDANSKKSDSKRSVIDHSQDSKASAASVAEEKQSKASSSSGGSGGGSGIANKISNFLVRRKSNLSNS